MGECIGVKFNVLLELILHLRRAVDQIEGLREFLVGA
jgi:hypothetical protein